MTRILSSRRARLGHKDALLGFASGTMRQVTLKGEPLYGLSAGCGTCGFYFERLGPLSDSILPTSILEERLRQGLTEIDEEVVDAFAELLPAEDYLVALLEIQPNLVMPGDVNDYFSHEFADLFGLRPPFYDVSEDPGTPYWRLGETVFEPPGRMYGYGEPEPPFQLRLGIFGFLAPTATIRFLRQEVVDAYISQSKTARPTGIALSIVDVKSPAVPMPGAKKDLSDGLQEHQCWGHFLLDGHHKVRAASLSGRAVTLLSFTALGKGTATPGEMDQLLEQLS